MAHAKGYRLYAGYALSTLLVVISIQGCSRLMPVEKPIQRVANLGENHPLTNKIWDVAENKFISEALLAEKILAIPFVLLGEKHDNALHHRLQANILQTLVKKGRKPTLAWEMFTQDKAPELERYLEKHPQDAKGLGPAGGWETRDGPSWEIYEPIAQVAMAASLKQVHADLPRKKPPNASGDRETDSSLVWLPSDLAQALAEDIEKSHCGHAPPPMIRTMLQVQQNRDAYMAQQFTSNAHPDHGAVLIAGETHTRQDRGVPFFMRHQQYVMQNAIVSLAFVEVQPKKQQAIEYGQTTQDDAVSFDYIWFTPRAYNEDPCIKFEEKLKRMKKNTAAENSVE